MARFFDAQISVDSRHSRKLNTDLCPLNLAQDLSLLALIKLELP